MIDRSRRHITHVRRWLRRGRAVVDALRPAPDPTAHSQRSHLHLSVPPDCDLFDREVAALAALLGVHVQAGGIAPAERSRLRAAGHDLDLDPVLWWEDVVIDRRLRPTYQAAISATRRPLDLEDWRPVSLPQIVMAPDATWAEVHLLQGAPTRVALVHQRRRLGTAEIDERLLDPEEPLHAPIRDGVARLSVPLGTWHLEVHAIGSGVVEAGALILGRYEEVVRTRRVVLIPP